MKVSRPVLAQFVTTLSLLALSKSSPAATIPLPDSSTCPNANGTCFEIVDPSTSSFAIGIRGSVAGAGFAVSGTSSSGVGVSGNSTTGNAVLGTSFTGTGVAGSATGSSGIGVYGTVIASGNSAIYGESHNSNAAWAGFFNGDINVVNAIFYGQLVQNSDARLKKDIADSQYGLAEVLKLRPVTYKWKQGQGDATQVGLIAQEVQGVVPEMVTTNRATGMLGVNYVALLPVMVKAVQEQQQALNRQQELIDRQEERLKKLEGARVSLSSLAPGAGMTVGMLPLGLALALALRKRGKESAR